MNALTLREIVAEMLGSLRLHVFAKCGGSGELRKTCWTRELPRSGTRHYVSGRKVYIVQARMEGRTRTVTTGNAKVLRRAQAMDVARRVLLHAQTGDNRAARHYGCPQSSSVVGWTRWHRSLEMLMGNSSRWSQILLA